MKLNDWVCWVGEGGVHQSLMMVVVVVVVMKWMLKFGKCKVKIKILK